MTLICIGNPPIAGCGKVLTEEDRLYYGTACEHCTRDWCEAIDAWRNGGKNAELDAFYGLAPQGRH
jgi:hypothetical protein